MGSRQLEKIMFSTKAQKLGKEGKGLLTRPDKVFPEGAEKAVIIKGLRAFTKLVQITQLFMVQPAGASTS